MGEANTLWGEVWDACRNGSLIWFFWWCWGFNKLGLWGKFPDQEIGRLYLIFACNSWFHCLQISVSSSFFIFVTDLL